jgi:antimicrobial peptide system SdpA family protein
MKKGFLVILFLFWTWIFLVVFSVSMPYNPIAKPFLKNRHYISGILPEGFAFFTRNPREDKLYFLVEEHNKLVNDPRLRNATLTNLFGFKRRGRILNLLYSTQLLRGNIRWYPINEDEPINFNDKKFVTNTVLINDSSLNLIKYKKFIVIKKKIIPWAYRNISKGTEGNAMFVKINVESK